MFARFTMKQTGGCEKTPGPVSGLSVVEQRLTHVLTDCQW